MGVNRLFMRWVMRRSIFFDSRFNALLSRNVTDILLSVLATASMGTTCLDGKTTPYSALSMLAAQATGAKSF